MYYTQKIKWYTLTFALICTTYVHASETEIASLASLDESLKPFLIACFADFIVVES